MDQENVIVKKEENMLRRGALIVFEGCDRAGKTTQCKKLVQALTQRNIPTKFMSFPDRTTAVGKIIDDYLTKKGDLSDRAIHLLFSANRWELEPTLTSLLSEGTTLIIDRYSFSGIAFSAAKQDMDVEWCMRPEEGLPKPDVVFYLNLSSDSTAKRGGFGNERYEISEFQNKVRKNFTQIQDSSWQVINADQSIEKIHEELLDISLKVINEAESKPLKRLW